MKKLVFILSVIFVITSCGKSEEEKLNDLVAKTTKASLFIPESYDPVSIKCDTLSTNFINDANIRKSVKIIELNNEIKNVQREIEINTEQQNYWQGKFGDFYRDYSKKVQLGEEKRDQLTAKAKDLLGELIKDYNTPREFIGYLVEHRFRAQNNSGDVMFGDVIYILNKDKSQIVAAYDSNDYDFYRFNQLTNAIYSLGKNFDLNEIDLSEICDNIKSRFEI